MLAVSVADTGRRRLELLRGVNIELAKRGDVRDRLSSALSLLVREICQQAVFDLYEADGKHSLLTAFVDPELERLAREVGRRYPMERVQASAMAPAAGASASEAQSPEAPLNDVPRPEVMLREVSDSLLGSIARDAEHLSLLRRFNATELCIVLVRGQRCVQGVLLLATDQGRRFDAADRTFVELLAERIAAHLGAAYWDTLLAPQRCLGHVRASSSASEREQKADPLQAILDSGLIGTLEWDGEGVIVDANPALVRLSGRPREALLSGEFRLQHLLVSCTSEDESAVQAPVVLERELRAPDGTHIPVLFGRVPWLGRHRHGIGFVVDVTEQQRRAEFEELLLGIVSHDLRNPLGVVTMAAALLLAQNLTDAQRRLASRIESAGRKSARLISDLLDFTIARRTGILLAPEPKDLHSVVAQAVDDLQANWPERSIVHDRFGDATSQLDQARVEQMAANLIGNALQHGAPGSVVRVETRGDESGVSFSVTNQGRPIPEDLMRQLFSPMRRGRNAGHRRGSIGIGLFIVHQLVLAHGGTIGVSSSEAEGTRFTVRLPRFPELACG